MSDIAGILVSAANDTYMASEDGPGYMDFSCRASMSAALATAMRKLAEYGDDVEFALNWRGYLRDLAEEIEAS